MSADQHADTGRQGDTLWTWSRDELLDEVRRLRRAISRHRKEVQCCEECSVAQIADAKAKRKATADGRLWAHTDGEA